MPHRMLLVWDTELGRKRLITITAARNYQLMKSCTVLKTNVLALFMENICPQCLLRHHFFPLLSFLSGIVVWFLKVSIFWTILITSNHVATYVNSGT